MAANFPNSPTNGQQFTVGNITWQWDSTAALWAIVKPIVIPDAPADGKDYVRIGNTWKVDGYKETKQLDQTPNTIIAIPTWAKKVKYSGRILNPNTSNHWAAMRITAGGTLLQTAGNYSYNGFYSNSSTGTITHINQNITNTSMILSNTGSSVLVPTYIEGSLEVARPSTAFNFSMANTIKGFGGNEVLISEYYQWIVSGTTSALRLDSFNIFDGQGSGLAWGAGSYIDLEWVP